MTWGKSPGKEYEEHVERALLRRYPKGKWNLERQCPILIKGTRSKIDFKLTNRKSGEEIVVDAKSGTVTVADLRQLEDYKRSCKASEAIIYTPTPLSWLSDSIKLRAKKSKIQIQHSAPRDSFWI
jgi:hypothetical protein